jgi:hypothetical protein
VKASPAEKPEPDPQGRITRDQEPFARLEITTVPPRVAPGESVRVHLLFEPNEAIKAHWNNEVDDLALWLHPPSGWIVEERLITTPNPPQPVTAEARRLEFELQVPRDATPGEHDLAAYALYYVCEDVTGQCLYRRQDIRIPIRIVPGK